MSDKLKTAETGAFSGKSKRFYNQQSPIAVTNDYKQVCKAVKQLYKNALSTQSLSWYCTVKVKTVDNAIRCFRRTHL